MIKKIIYSYVSGVHWNVSSIFSAIKFTSMITSFNGNLKFL